MSKKLMSLVLVLAIAGMASALQWVGPSGSQAAGNWTTTSNWNTGVLPGAADSTTKLYRSDGFGANIVVTSAVTGGIKPQMSYSPSGVILVEIQSGGSITNSGSVDGYNGTYTVTIQAGGAWNSSTTGGSFKVAANTTVNANTDIINVYGTLAVKGTGTSTLGITNDSRAGTTLVNSGTVNIYGGGLADVDVYTIGTYGVGRIKIWSNGTLKIKTDVTAQVNADITAGKILRGDGGSLTVSTDGSYTYVTPEPATVALLGLGSLMLLRRKR